MTPANLATQNQAKNQALQVLADEAKAFASQSKASATRKAYRADWQAFALWCEARGLAPLPSLPSTLTLYVADLAKEGLKPSTIKRALVSISQAHKLAGHQSPTSHSMVLETMKGIKRALGTAPAQKAPVTLLELRAMLERLPGGAMGARDKALLLVGFAGGFRRSELVALDVLDVAFTSEGIEITIRRSKTDQEGEGRKVGIPHGSSPLMCPVLALKAWLELACISTGAVFLGVDRWGNILGERMSDKGVARAVQRYAKLAGLEPSRFAGHSLRAGLATAAARAGKSERAIMQQTGHKSVAMVRRYIREASLFQDNAASGLL